MQKTLICTICGQPFTATRSDAKYCGIECRLRAKRQAINDTRDRQAKENRQRSAQRNAEIRKKLDREASARRRAAERDNGPDTVAYWKDFKREELRFAKQIGEPSTAMVNGVSVNDANFEKKVIKTVEEYHSVYLCRDDSFNPETGYRRSEGR